MEAYCNASDLGRWHPYWLDLLNSILALPPESSEEGDSDPTHFSESTLHYLHQSTESSVFGDNSSTSAGDNETFLYFNCSDPESVLRALNLSVHQDPLYFPLSVRVIGSLLQGIIFLLGLLGNLLVVWVVARMKTMRSPTNIYLGSMAVSDCIVLLTSVPQEIMSYYLLGGEWIWGSGGCAVSVFLQNLGINVSSLILTAFTIERYIGICKPLQAQRMCTLERAYKIIVGLWTFAIVYCSPWLFLTASFPIAYKGHGIVETCEHKLSRQQYLGYYMSDFIGFYVVPLILSLYLYTRIAKHLHRRHVSIFTYTGSDVSLRVHDNLDMLLRRSFMERVKIVKLLAIVVIVFAILWFPYRGLLVYNSFVEERFMNIWYLMMCKTCVYLNSAINPILYNLLSVKFRRAFRETLSCEIRMQERRQEGG